jgi:hypothetical protein
VNDERPASLAGERDLRGEGFALPRRGRVVIMVVQTAFTDRDGAAIDGVADAGDVASSIKVRGIVGVDAGGEEREPGVATGEVRGPVGGDQRFPDADDRARA